MSNLRLQVPQLFARVSSPAVAATLAKLIASGAAATRTELCRATGLSRTTVDAGLDTLFDLGALRVDGLRDSAGRGRRAELLAVESNFGAVVAVDFGIRTRRVAIADLGQELLAEEEAPSRVADGPELALSAAVRDAQRMLDEVDLGERQRITVVTVPGPVDASAGAVFRPPTMPGWDGFPIRDFVEGLLGGVVIVVNDVNVRALGEARAGDLGGPLLYVKIGSGIGAGLASGSGELLSGADGAAGDLGHLRAFGSDAACACGQIGCLEATASGAALARMADPSLAGPHGVNSFVDLVRRGDPKAIGLMRGASLVIGEAISSLVRILNPAEVLLGGDLASASDELLAGVRQVVCGRTPSLATRNLSVRDAPLGARAGIAGAIVLGSEYALSSTRFEELLAKRSRTTHLASLIRYRSQSAPAA